MAANTTSVHNVSGTMDVDQWNDDNNNESKARSNRASNMSSSGMNDRNRGSQGNSVGKGFGASKASWKNNIWGDSNLGGLGDGKLSHINYD